MQIKSLDKSPYAITSLISIPRSVCSGIFVQLVLIFTIKSFSVISEENMNPGNVWKGLKLFSGIKPKVFLLYYLK